MSAAPPQRALRTDFNVEPVGFLSHMKEKARALKDSAQQKYGELKEVAKAAKKASKEAMEKQKSKV